MTKKIFALISAVLFTASAFAQSTELKRDTVTLESTDKYKVTTNRFFDNWFIDAAAGGQMYYGDHNKQMKFGDRITPVYEINLGKWFTPGIGVRAGYSGYKIVGVTQNGSHSTGERYDGRPWEGYWLENQEFNYFHLHGDVLFNLTNIIGGYKADRFYNVSPYIGLGWMATNDEPKQREPSVNVGINNAFRLNNAFDLLLDLRGNMVKDRFDGEEGNRKEEGILSAAIGITYKFKKRGWDKPVTTIITYDEAEVNAMRDRLHALVNDNDALRKQLADAKSKTITDIKIEKQLLVAPILVTFPINKSTVSNEARVNLGFFAKMVIESKSNIVYNVSGYADSGTGSVATNQRLSKERADAIYAVLVRELGVPASQLKVSYHGGVENMYFDDPRLSRAVITMAE